MTCSCCSGRAGAPSTTFTTASPSRWCRAGIPSRFPSASAPRARWSPPLDEAAAQDRIAQALQGGDYRSVAICFLNSYANPAHERRVAAMIAERFPAVGITCSCDVTREFREYERASTTTLAAYVQPVIDRYLGEFERALGRARVRGPLQPDAIERRQTACARHGGQRDRLALFGAGGGRDGRDPASRAVRLPRPHHLRHGRHEHRCVPGAGRNPGAHQRRRDRRPPHPHPGARHRDGGSGRRLDRLAGRRRHAAGGPALGGRRARPRLLPARRCGAHDHRRAPRARHGARRYLPRWAHGHRSCTLPRVIRGARLAIRPQRGADRRRRGAGGRAQHRPRDPVGLDRAGSRSARLRPGALRRRGGRCTRRESPTCSASEPS